MGKIDAEAVVLDDGTTFVKKRLRTNPATTEDVFDRFEASGTLYDEYGVDAIDHLDELKRGRAVNVRGGLFEEVVYPNWARSRYTTGKVTFETDSNGDLVAKLDRGYLAEEEIPFEMDTSKPGFDGLAIDRNGRLVITEAKANGNNLRAKQGTTGIDEKTDFGKQGSEEYIERKFKSWAQEAVGNPKKQAFLDALEHRGYIDIKVTNGEFDIEANMRKINVQLVQLQDAPMSGEIAARTMRKTAYGEPSFDTIIVVKPGKVFEMPATTNSMAEADVFIMTPSKHRNPRSIKVA